jgi:glutamyl-tRNA synthetase
MVQKAHQLVRTRFAPSPTGFLHIGGLRTALYEYAFAKSQGGKFILRIEDTDRKRYVQGSLEDLLKTLRIFNLNWDEGPEVNGPYAPYIQSERVKKGIYKRYAEKLVETNSAYYCFCQPKTKVKIAGEYSNKKAEVRDPCRDLPLDESKKRVERGELAAIRLRVPDSGETSFYDFILKKKVSWENKNVDEAMLLKSDGFPTYHLAVVVDDAEMKISHILRGLEWMPSTPIHILIFNYLKFPIPQIGHFTMILDPKGGKLSKRKGSVACEDYLKEGYLPEAILSYIMLLGWAPKDNREIFSLKEFIENFQKGSLQLANPVFNRDKLDWFNGYYIRQMESSKFKDQIYEFYKRKYPKELIEKISPLVKERITKLSDFSALAGFFFARPKVEKSLLGKNSAEHLASALERLEDIKKWTKEEIDKSLLDLVGEKRFKTGDFFMDLRIAICGSKFTPPINDSIVVLGKEETLTRIKALLQD